MTQREKLIELILNAPRKDVIYGNIKLDKPVQTAQTVADHLLANGVIVPPCEVGDTVWFETFKKNATVCVGIQPHTVERIDVTLVCDTASLVETKIPDWMIGNRVFLTREDAEKALAERSEGK